MTAVGFHRDRGKPAGVRRLHVAPMADARQAYCSAATSPHRNSPGHWLDPLPATPPAGMHWCPVCLGRWAEAEGILDELAGYIVGRLEEEALIARLEAIREAVK